MPVYTRQLSVPAGTPQSNPETTTIAVEERWVDRAVRFAPPGSNATVNVELRFGEARLLPEEGESAVILPATTDPEPVAYRLPGSPSEVEFRAWSPNASFEHTLTLKLVTQELARARPLERLVDLFSSAGRVRRGRVGAGEDITGTEGEG